MDERILIVGAGPAGLGAGLRLQELGHHNWIIYEKEPRVGGLSASFTDDKGFIWDQGGHVLFSSDANFNHLFENVMEGEYIEHQREAWIRYGQRWIPYPFQNNIQSLPLAELADCIRGLVRARHLHKTQLPSNFREWIEATFGEGIAERFMYPYNRKVWAYPLEDMSHEWIAERVSVPGFARILRNAILRIDDAGWGPNNIFKFPSKGGTGDLFERMAGRIKEKILLGKEIAHIDSQRKTIKTVDGDKDTYDIIVNTAPLDEVVPMLDSSSNALSNAARGLQSNSVIVVGVGLERPNTSSRCWIYSPDPSVPFYRVTNFSHYSPYNVPGGDVRRYSSLMCETAYRGDGISTDVAIEGTLQGLHKIGLLERDNEPISIDTKVLPKAYPIPTRDRNDRLAVIQEHLNELDIYSIGRFGAWKYEIGNMDHAVMMGMTTVDMLAEASS